MAAPTNHKTAGIQFDLKSRINNKILNKNSLLKTAAMLTLWAIIPIAYVLQGQDTNWDLQNYHLYNTILFFEDKLSTDIAPAGMQTYYNPLVSFPAYWIHRVASTPLESFGYGLALASVQGLCGPIVFAITQLIVPVSKVTAFCIALFGLTSPMLLSEAGSSMADLTICVLQLSSIYICLRSRQIPEASRAKFLSLGWGILGAACAIKFSAVFALPIALLISIIVLLEKDKPILNQISVKQLIGAIIIPWLIGFTVFGWFWFQRSWSDNGNPLYPLFSSIFGESRIFTTDNHEDKRFVVDGFLEYFTAPFMEFINRPNHRAEMAYRDMRPMLSIYLSAISLSITMIGIASNKLKASWLSNQRFIIIVGLQIGLLISYLIWMKEAGIARYTMHLQILSGVYVYSSLISFSKTKEILTGQQFSLQKLNSIVTSSRLFYIFTFLLALSIITTQVPNWGRANFDLRWNTLKPLGSDKEFSSTSYLLDDIIQAEKNKPIVLVDKPLGWLKQYAPKGIDFSLVDNYLRESLVEKIRSTIIASGGQFTVIGLSDENKISTDMKVSLAKDKFRFNTLECKDYITPTKIQVRACKAIIENGQESNLQVQ